VSPRGEAVQEPGALVQLDQQRHDRRERQHLGEFRLERHRLGRDVLGGQRRDHQVAAVVQVHRAITGGQHSLQLPERLAQLVLGGGQGAGGVGRFAHELAELRALRRPLLRGQQVGGGVGIAPRAGHVHIAAAQSVAQPEQGAQLPVVPVGAGVTGLARGVEVAAPPRGHEPIRRLVGDAPGAGGVELPQDLHRLQQPCCRGPAGEPDGGQDLRGELPQVPVGAIQGGQVPVVARQPGRGLLPCRPQAWPPDPLAPDQPADLFVVQPQVEDDVQEIVEQGLAVLTGLPALGQRVAHLPLGLAFPRRDGLVEQAHDLVEHVGRRLRQQREQDRVAALRISPPQRLGGQPAADGGQEPAPLGREHRQVQGVRAQAAQERQLRDLRLHRGRGRLDRAGGQPPQPRGLDLGVGDQQPIQRGAPGVGELVCQPGEGLPLRLLAGVRDPLDHDHRPRPDHPRGDQVSHASRNSSVGESCSIARASRNSSSSLNSSVDGGRHPRYCATRRRCSVRVFARRP
jgi:hypothetical protein